MHQCTTKATTYLPKYTCFPQSLHHQGQPQSEIVRNPFNHFTQLLISP